MGEQVEPPGVGSAHDVGRLGQLGARGQGAVEIIDILRGPCRRGPGKQHRDAFEIGVFDELRQPQDRIADRVVVPVHEEQDLSVPGRQDRQRPVYRRDERSVGIVGPGVDDGEFGIGIGRQDLGAFKFAGPVGRRDRHDDRGQTQFGGASAGIERPDHLGRLARGRDVDLALGRLRDGGHGGFGVVDADQFRRARTGGQAAQQKHDHEKSGKASGQGFDLSGKK